MNLFLNDSNNLQNFHESDVLRQIN